MKLYEPRKVKDDTTPPWVYKTGTIIGMVLGVASGAAIETTLIWAIAAFLIGLPVTWVQIFGCLLIFNGLAARFSVMVKSDDK